MTPLDDLIHLSFLGTTGPGASDLDPMALVVDNLAAERISQMTSAVESQALFEPECEQCYGAVYYVLSGNLIYGFSVYYRAYDDDGEIVSKTALDENNPSLGRVNTLSVPPPHTVSSLKNRIIIFEDLSGHEVQEMRAASLP